MGFASLLPLPLLWATVALSQAGSAAVDASFANPPAEFRPFFRYWLPDASVSPDVIAEDVELIKRAGAGGFELLGYYNYGGTQADPAFSVTDWTKYGWGTESWKEIMRAAFRASKSQGLRMDFALGPNQGSGVPAQPDDEGLMQNLVPFNVSIPIGGLFNDSLPGWGHGKLVSASTALVVEQRPANLSVTPGFQDPYYYNGTKNVLARRSLQDVSDAVSETGHLDIAFPTNETGVEYRLFAFYQKASGYREQVSPERIVQSPQSPVTSFVEYGSWVNDHFSVAGARIIIDFWENYLLDDDLRQLLREVGSNAWEDSIEFGTGVAVWWTPNMLQEFRSMIGYDFAKYLPLLLSHVSETPGPLPSPDQFFTDDLDQGQSYLNDYYATLTALNRLYMTTLSEWVNTALQCNYSAQVVYNLPMEMAANIPAVDVPECESLGFFHLVDACKQFSGPANLAGRNIISNELGAVQLAAYTQTLPELIWDVKRSIMGGVNRMVYHGYPYSGYYPNTTWPGYTTFYYVFSAMHGPRQPAWAYYDDYMNWTARMQYVAQSGVPKIDVAFWVDAPTTYEIFSRYNATDMDDVGFTYEYISPSNFELPNAYVKDGVLAPDRQAFKALVVRKNDTMTLSGAQKIEEWALNGLTIVFTGGIPTTVSRRAEKKNIPAITSTLRRAAKIDNVYVVPEENLATSLRSIAGLRPKAQVETGGNWLTYWRDDDKASRTFVVLYNDAAEVAPGEGQSTGSITFAARGAPYLYDAWTGTSIAVRVCQQSSDGLTIPFSLAGNESVIVAFHHDEAPDCPLSHLPEGVSVYGRTETAELLLQHSNAFESSITHNGHSVVLAGVAQSLTLSNWTLVVESWLPPNASMSDKPFEPYKSNSSFTVSELKPWTAVSDSLRNVSGRGFYSTHFEWPLPGEPSDGAEIELGHVLHTARVWINGRQLPPLDPVKPVSDVTRYLVMGRNEVTIAVSTTLGGAVRAYWTSVATAGVPASLTAPPPDEQPYGLVAPVRIIPFGLTRLSMA